MTINDALAGDRGWAPDSCTLPTAEQPLRVTEFDDLFAASVRAVERINLTTVQLVLGSEAEGRAKELAARERRCCSFFRFEFSPPEDGAVTMRVRVSGSQAAVLDALTIRAATIAGLGR